MPIHEIPFGGWSRNLCLANESVELIISLEVGPRILSYRPPGGENILHTFPEQMGGADEIKWMSRGGHRLWIAPEDEVLSYLPDNQPFPYEITGENSVRLTTPAPSTRPIRKEVTVDLAATGSAVTVTHTLTNEAATPETLAPWALSVMAPGGTSIVPQPELGEHPRDLLPNRTLVLWPYCDATDPRFQLGRHFITLRQDAQLSSFKFGLAHQGKWAAYLLGDQLFTKTVAFIAGAAYPDLGCNYESFTNEEMLEIETLGPLVSLAPGESISHVETWQLHTALHPPACADTSEFARWLQPFLPL